MKIDVERARRAVVANIGDPLGLDEAAAISAMENAWVAAVAAGIGPVAPDTVLAAFGGAGPFVICRIAAAVGVDRVLIPKLAAVFSAFGIGFSDIGVSETGGDEAAVRLKVRRAMAAEGLDPAACEETLTPVDGGVRVDSRYRLPHPALTGEFRDAATVAVAAGTRLGVPLYRTADLVADSGAAGPAVLEDPYFTCRVDAGWRFDANAAGDLLLTRLAS